MKHNKYLFLLIFAFALSSCQKENINVAEKSLSISSDSKSMYQMVYNTDFKEDFICSPYLGTGYPKRPPTREEKHFSNISHKKDVDYLRQQYPSVKRQIEEWYSNDKINQSFLIQNMALRYLRNYFLVQEDESVNQEIVYLLEVLVHLEAVDIDVLADAYFRVENELSRRERKEYLSYIENLYRDAVTQAKTRGLAIQADYEAATDAQEKAQHQMSARLLERKIRSYVYARDLLGLVVRVD